MMSSFFRPFHALNRGLTLVGLERKDSSISRIDEKEKLNDTVMCEQCN